MPPVATAWHQAHQAVTHQVLGNARPARDDFAANLQAQHVGCTGRWLGDSLSLHDVRPIDPCGKDAQKNFAGAGFGDASFNQRQHSRVAGRLGDDGLHVGGVALHTMPLVVLLKICRRPLGLPATGFRQRA